MKALERQPDNGNEKYFVEIKKLPVSFGAVPSATSVAHSAGFASSSLIKFLLQLSEKHCSFPLVIVSLNQLKLSCL